MKTCITHSCSRIMTVLLLFLGLSLTTQAVLAQCVAPTLKFYSPVLISGTDGQVGAIYRFANVIPGVDAHVKISGISGGATLYNIDDTTGVGYYDAFQPYVGASANDTSYIDWRIDDLFMSCRNAG